MAPLELPYVILIALALAMDTFTVAWAIGSAIKTISMHQVGRLSFHFGFFQFIMLILGRTAGGTVEVFIADFDHLAAFGLLAFIGCRMIWKSLRSGRRHLMNDPTRGVSLLTLSIATSIDSLAVGFSLALVDAELLYPSLIVGFTAALMTIGGALTGARSRRLLGEKAGIIGGIVLILIGARILLSHLLEL